MAISNNQIKSISSDFCGLYSESCEKCTEMNHDDNFDGNCFWNKENCESSLNLNFNERINGITSLHQCELLRTTTTTSTSSTTTTTTTKKTTIGSFNSIILPILGTFQNLTNNQPLVTRSFQYKSILGNSDKEKSKTSNSSIGI